MFGFGKTALGIHLQNLSITEANALQKNPLVSKPEKTPSLCWIRKVKSAPFFGEAFEKGGGEIFD